MMMISLSDDLTPTHPSRTRASGESGSNSMILSDCIFFLFEIRKRYIFTILSLHIHNG